MPVEECVEEKDAKGPFIIPLSLAEIASEFESRFDYMTIFVDENTRIVRTREPTDIGKESVYGILIKDGENVDVKRTYDENSKKILNERLRCIERRIELEEPPNDEECERYGAY